MNVLIPQNTLLAITPESSPAQIAGSGMKGKAKGVLTQCVVEFKEIINSILECKSANGAESVTDNVVTVPNTLPETSHILSTCFQAVQPTPVDGVITEGLIESENSVTINQASSKPQAIQPNLIADDGSRTDVFREVLPEQPRQFSKSETVIPNPAVEPGSNPLFAENLVDGKTQNTTLQQPDLSTPAVQVEPNTNAGKITPDKLASHKEPESTSSTPQGAQSNSLGSGDNTTGRQRADMTGTQKDPAAISKQVIPDNVILNDSPENTKTATVEGRYHHNNHHNNNHNNNSVNLTTDRRLLNIPANDKVMIQDAEDVQVEIKNNALNSTRPHTSPAASRPDTPGSGTLPQPSPRSQPEGNAGNQIKVDNTAASENQNETGAESKGNDIHVRTGNEAITDAAQQGKAAFKQVLESGSNTHNPTQQSKLIDPEELVSSIKLNLGNGAREMLIRLKPETMGRAIILMKQIGNDLKLDFLVEKDSARQAIRGDTDRLQESLGAAGFQNVSIDVRTSESDNLRFSVSDDKKGSNDNSSNPGNGRDQRRDDTQESEMYKPRNLGYNTFDLIA